MARRGIAWFPWTRTCHSSWPYLTNRSLVTSLGTPQNAAFAAWLLQKCMKWNRADTCTKNAAFSASELDNLLLFVGPERVFMGKCRFNAGQRHEIDRRETSSRPAQNLVFSGRLPKNPPLSRRPERTKVGHFPHGYWINRPTPYTNFQNPVGVPQK